MNWTRWKVRSSERAIAFASTVFPTPGHVLDEHVTLGEEAEEREPERLGRRVDRGAEVRDDALGERGGVRARADRLGRALGHDRSPRSSCTASRIAPATSCFVALGTWRSPVVRDQQHLVVGALEADVGSAHVVVDDEVDVLLGEHRTLARETVLPALGAERDEHLAVPSRRREGPCDVRRSARGRRSTARCSSGACRRCTLGRPVVRDRGRHQDHVRVVAGERLAAQIGGGRRRHDLDAFRRGDLEVRGEQGHGRPTVACRLRERGAHPAGGSVPEEPDARRAAPASRPR